MAQQHQFCRSYNGSQLLGPHNPGVSPAPVAQQSAWPQVLDESVKKLAHRHGRREDRVRRGPCELTFLYTTHQAVAGPGMCARTGVAGSRGALEVGESLAENADGGFDLGVGQVGGGTQPQERPAAVSEHSAL